jgi:SanA protein
MKLLWLCLAAACLVLAVVGGSNWWIIAQTKAQLFTTVAAVPANDVALVLGTSPKIGGRWANPFFEGRMDAAAALYRAGKVRHLLLSGDNRKATYDEPTSMREALAARGVPESAMTLDYAGFRTLDSLARARAVFGVEQLTIVTDDFHQNRALFLAEAHGVQAVGLASEPVRFEWSKKTRLREIGSRVKACLDVYVLGTEPRFYGPREPLRLAARTE